jgi:hypothetical protein
MHRLLIPLLALLALAPAAARADTQATCTNLQSALDTATPGETIVLNGTCSNQSFTLPSAPLHAPITLRGGAPGAGFFHGASSAALSGTDVGTTTISGLTFVGNGLVITGASAPQILDSTFDSTTGALSVEANLPGATTMIRGNTITSNVSQGGAGMVLRAEAGNTVVSGNVISHNRGIFGTSGLSASTSPGASLTVSGNRFEGNSVAGGLKPATGGGMALSVDGGTVTIAQNQFLGNSAGGDLGGGGGGLAIDGSGHVAQVGNLFSGNSAGAPNGTAAGAGESIAGVRVDSTRDTFTANRIDSPGGEGAGVAVQGQTIATAAGGELHAADLVASGNSTAVGGRGAGIFVGSVGCGAACTSALELNDSTVAGNCVDPGAGSQAPGIGGSGDDTLVVRNSIVYDHQQTLPCTPSAPLIDIAGFASASISQSDVCPGLAASGAAFAGSGNICADPLLDNPQSGGFHETASSPTIDAGSNTLVPAGLTVDADGQSRVTDGNGDAAAIVDMGADESPGPPLAADKTPPKLTIVSRTVRETATQRVHIRVKCVERTHCGGTLSITVTSRRKHYGAGSGRFNIVGGHTKTVIFKLRKKARSLLKHHSRIRVTAMATARDLAGNTGHTKKRVTVKARKRLRR